MRYPINVTARKITDPLTAVYPVTNNKIPVCVGFLIKRYGPLLKYGFLLCCADVDCAHHISNDPITKKVSAIH